MIELIRAMVRARRLQTLTIVLLATITIGAAVSVPAFLTVVDDSVIQSEVANASVSELDVFATQRYQLTSQAVPASTDFGRQMTAMLAGPGFTGTFSATTDAAVAGKTMTFPQLEFRQDQCVHVVITAGRCPVGTAEIMIDPKLVRDAGLAVGQTATLTYAYKDPKDAAWLPAPLYIPLTVSVVGIYRPRDATEPFWGQTGQFDDDFTRGADAPMLTTAGTITTFHHRNEIQTVDAVLQPAALTVGGQTFVTTSAGLPTSISNPDAIGSALGQFPELNLPGTDASWTSAPLTSNLDVVGSPQVHVEVLAPSAEATQLAGPGGVRRLGDRQHRVHRIQAVHPGASHRPGAHGV